MAFSRTKKSTEKFCEAVSCTTESCQSSGDLQYLGITCKHPYCWGCIYKFNKMNKFPNCGLCGALLEPARPLPALIHNNLAEGLDRFKLLLAEYEEAVKREGAGASATQHQTQALFDCNFEQPPPTRTVDEFLSTQFPLNALGLEKSRSNTPEGTPPHNKKTPRNSMSSRKPRRMSRLSFESPPLPVQKSSSVTAAPSKVNEEAVDHEYHRSAKLSLLKTRFTGAVSSKCPSPVRKIASPKKPIAEAEKPMLFQTQMLDITLNTCDQTQPIITPAVIARQFDFNKAAVPFMRQSKSNTTEDLCHGSENVAPQPRKYSSEISKPVCLEETPHRWNLKPTVYRTPSNDSLGSQPSQGRRRLSNAKDLQSIVMEAVVSGDLEKLKDLLNSDYDPNEYCHEKGTPLYVAVGFRRQDMCQALIESGALINVPCGPLCNTALHLAVDLGDEDIAKYLLSKGASKRDKNRLNRTASEVAAASSPLRALIDQYRQYPRQPSIPPALPPKQYIVLDSDVTYRYETRKLNSWFSIRGSLDERTTHFVVRLKNGVAQATNTYMQALLSGVHIISTEWLDECLKKDIKITHALQYEVESVRYGEGETAKRSAEKWRKRYDKRSPGVFRGCKFYLFNAKYGDYGTRTFISELIRLCQGDLLNSEPIPQADEPAPFFRKEDVPKMSSYFILYDPKMTLPAHLSNNQAINKVSVEWLFQCMLHFQFFSPY